MPTSSPLFRPPQVPRSVSTFSARHQSDVAGSRRTKFSVTYLSPLGGALTTFYVTVRPDTDDGSVSDIRVQTSTLENFATFQEWTAEDLPDFVESSFKVGPLSAGTIYIRVTAGNSSTGEWVAWSQPQTLILNDLLGNAIHGAYVNHGVTLTLARDGYYEGYVNHGVNLTLDRDNRQYHYREVLVEGPDPELWAVWPQAARPQDGVMLYGHGMGANQTQWNGSVEVLIDNVWTPVLVVSWVRIASSADWNTPASAIEPGVPNVDPEHNEIAILVPLEAAPLGHWVRVKLETV